MSYITEVNTFSLRAKDIFLLLEIPIIIIIMFVLQLKTVHLLDALQLLMLSAETLISLEDKMFPLNIFYYKQDTGFYVIYLLHKNSVHNFLLLLLLFYYYFNVNILYYYLFTFVF
jgi:hypothetical protein